MLEKVKTIAEHIKKTVSFNPEVGIILGSGLGGLVKEIEVTKELTC